MRKTRTGRYSGRTPASVRTAVMSLAASAMELSGLFRSDATG